MADGVPANLSNPTGIELQVRYDWVGIKRYINNLYIPFTLDEDWDLETVVQDYRDQMISATVLAVLNTNCFVDRIVGRVRGRSDAGVTHTEEVNVAGTASGAITPAWLTMTLRQIPDNVNRLILVPGTSIFRQGRISLPGVSTSDILGNTVTGAALTRYEAAAEFFASVGEGADPELNPGFGLAMTRVVGGVLQAKCNMSQVVPGELGTQLTARD